MQKIKIPSISEETSRNLLDFLKETGDGKRRAVNMCSDCSVGFLEHMARTFGILKYLFGWRRFFEDRWGLMGRLCEATTAQTWLLDFFCGLFVQGKNHQMFEALEAPKETLVARNQRGCPYTYQFSVMLS